MVIPIRRYKTLTIIAVLGVLLLLPGQLSTPAQAESAHVTGVPSGKTVFLHALSVLRTVHQMHSEVGFVGGNVAPGHTVRLSGDCSFTRVTGTGRLSQGRMRTSMQGAMQNPYHDVTSDYIEIVRSTRSMTSWYRSLDTGHRWERIQVKQKPPLIVWMSGYVCIVLQWPYFNNGLRNLPVNNLGTVHLAGRTAWHLRQREGGSTWSDIYVDQPTFSILRWVHEQAADVKTSSLEMVVDYSRFNQPVSINAPTT